MLNAARTLRLSAKHDVVLFDRLPASQRERLAALRRDPEFFGVVMSREGVSPSTMIAASRDVALLLFALRDPGPLPDYIVDAHNPDIERTIDKLILDGVLEVATDGGEFVSGPAALAATQSDDTGGRIAKLSREAAAYAASLNSRDRFDIEARLYRHNRVAVTPVWSTRIPTPGALREFLGLDRGATAALLNRRWESLPAGESDAWFQWVSRDGDDIKASERDVNYKLYVSPLLADLPAVFATVVSVLAEARVTAFKVGGTAHDVARPDKIVAYFRTQERALECGALLCTALDGARVQGVPFSAELGADGLVSWGVDPAEIPGRPPQSSWRRWVCRRLAHYIDAAAMNPPSHVEGWRFAFERLRLDGVNTTTWEPSVSMMATGGMSA